jgi:hypothetical protein
MPSSSTGDVLNNVQRVLDFLHVLRYPRGVSARRLALGDAAELLPLLHFALLDFSPHVAAFVAARGFVLYAKDDAAFTNAVFRLATLHLGVAPRLKYGQFLSRGFVGASCGARAVRRAAPPRPAPSSPPSFRAPFSSPHATPRAQSASSF